MFRSSEVIALVPSSQFNLVNSSCFITYFLTKIPFLICSCVKLYFLITSRYLKRAYSVLPLYIVKSQTY